MGWKFWQSDEDELRDLVADFPDRFERLRLNWIRFKMGVEQGLFSTDERRRIIDVYRRFPETWESIKPNWTFTETGLVSAHRSAFVDKVDTWAEKLRSELEAANYQATRLGDLGVLPVLVVAGLWILGVGGTVAAAVIGALAWFKDAENEETLIELVTAGRISEDVLKQRYEAEASGGLFSGLGGVVKLGIAAGLIFMFGPQLKKMISPERNRA